MNRQVYSREQWLAWIGEQAESGLSISAFCQQNGVGANSFYLWRRKLAGDLQQSRPADAFVPLSIIVSEQVEIELPCGAMIRMAANEASTLRVVLSTLIEIGD